MISCKNQKAIRIGILSNEFFDITTGRMGGFGWAARQVVKYFSANPDLNIELVLLSGSRLNKNKGQESKIHGVKVVDRDKNPIKHFNDLKNARLDLILTIDYRSSYRKILYRLPTTPVLVWVRDPRTMEDMNKVRSIKYPQLPGVIPAGLDHINCKSLARVAGYSSVTGRRLALAATTPYLLNKIPETYGAKLGSSFILPNIIDLPSGSIGKSETPEVVFLGRLDPYKRPWVFIELARHFPDVRFTVLGQAHFGEQDKWLTRPAPDNLSFAGHIGEDEKKEYLSRAWALINTSVHEGLAVSFLEALKMETPVLSSVNPENVVTRFGIFTGNFQGDGMEALPYFIRGLSTLIADRNLRERLGKEGRQWVEQEHNGENFYKNLCEISAHLGVELPKQQLKWSE